MRNRFGSIGLGLLFAALTACEPNGSLGGSANPALTSDSSIPQFDASVEAGSPDTLTTNSPQVNTITATGIDRDTAHTHGSSSDAETSLPRPLGDAGTSTENHPATQTTSPTAVTSTLESKPATTAAPDGTTTTTPETELTETSTLDASLEDPVADAANADSTSSDIERTSVDDHVSDAAAITSVSDLSTSTARTETNAASTASDSTVTPITVSESTTNPSTAPDPTSTATATAPTTSQHPSSASITTQSTTVSSDSAASEITSFDYPDAAADAGVDGGSAENSEPVGTTAAPSTGITASPESTTVASNPSSETTSTLIPLLDAGDVIEAGYTYADSSWAPTEAGTNLDASFDAAPAECEDGSERQTEDVCGLNDRGKVDAVCAGGTWVPSSCSDPDVCVDDTTQTLPCDVEGLQVQVCVTGAWQDTMTCPEGCEPDSTQEGTTPCGLNSRGVLVQACIDANWVDTTTCADPDACEDDSTRLGETFCGLNTRGQSIERCVAGQWIDTGTCQDTDVCVDDASESTETACGLNGRGLLFRRCTTGQWEASECADLDVCTDTTEQFMGACGLNLRGIWVQTCSLGQWSPNVCVDSDVCADESARPSDTACGLNSRGTLEQVCTLGQWQTSDVCFDTDVCADTSTRAGTVPCEVDTPKTLRQVCTNGAWVDSEECELPEACENDSIRVGSTACGLNGRGTLTQMCVAGAWQDTASCVDTDTCVDEAVELSQTSCGLNERGLLLRQCLAGSWTTTDTCIDPDVCVDATSRQGGTPCGLNGRGLLEQVCEAGSWLDSAECVDPDECVDGTVQTGTTPCQGRGALQQTCEEGTWVDDSLCIKPPVLHPNILLVVSDDVGAESTSIYPNVSGTTTPVPTPTIEQLAAQGITFDNAWASPMCSPTRATIMSGKYGNRTGVTAAGLELPTVHETLHERIGVESPTYAMGVFGKWHLSGTNENTDQATEVLHVLASGVPTFRGFVGAAVEDFFRWEAVDQSGNVSLIEQYSTTSITDWAIEYIQQREAESPDAPWFVYVPYNAAHDPYQVPPSGLHNVDLAGLAEGTAATSVPVYKAMLQALDTEFGRLMNVIDLNDTIVIYMGDNGTPREVKEAGTNVRGSKQGVYEGGLRVPLVISGAGVNRVGEREDELVVSSDLYATILSLTGIDTAQIYDSYALNPLFEARDSSTGRTHSFSELCNSTGAHYAIRNAQYKLMYEDRRFQLYDLLNDPLETRNLYSDPTVATVRSELEAALAEIRAGSSAGCFR